MKLLVDLKPALDGYAGIPQECRLLFKALVQIDGIEVEGLIQHGARVLRGALPTKDLSRDEQVDLLSKFVVSLYEKPLSSFSRIAAYEFQHQLAKLMLRLCANFRIELKLQRFEADLFEDFLWRNFFSKTLNSNAQLHLMRTRHRVLRPPRQMMHKAGLEGLRYPQTGLYATLNTMGFDAFISQNPFPGRVSKPTQMVVRYHDSVPLLMPHTTRNKALDQAAHFHALKDNVKQGAWFACISKATRNDLLSIFPEAEKRTIVIYNIVSEEYYPDKLPPSVIYQIVRNRIATKGDVKTDLQQIYDITTSVNLPPLEYLLMVSTIEPRKNHALLIRAWEILRYSSRPNLKLIIVGNIGWDETAILQSFRPWAARGELYWLTDVPCEELRSLYTHAQLTICPGLAEGFDYSGVEALRCGCRLIASDIPVHHEIFGKNAVYINKYDPENAALKIEAELTRYINSEKKIGKYIDLFNEEKSKIEWKNFLVNIIKKNPKKSN